MRFLLKSYFKSGESVIATQEDFRAHFTLSQNDVVLERKSILIWVENSIAFSYAGQCCIQDILCRLSNGNLWFLWI